MKYIILLVLLSVLGCHSEDTTMEYLNNGVNLSIDWLNDMNSVTLAKFEAAMHENPQATKKYKDIADKTATRSKVLHSEIDSLQYKLTLNLEVQDKTLKLKKEINEYKEFIDSIAEKDTLLTKSIDKIILNFEEVTFDHLVLLKNKITLLEKYVLDRQYQKIGGVSYIFNKMKVGISYEKSNLRTDEYLNTDLRLLEYDSTFKFSVIIDGNAFNSMNGIVNYKDTSNQSTGDVNKKGTLVWESYNTKRQFTDLLSIKYKILK